MSKSIPITEEMKAQIRNAVGDPNLDVSSLVVFECTAISTQPLNKAGTLFENGVVTRSTLMEMALVLNNGGAAHLHTLHNQGYELPLGRVFAASVVDNDQGSELRALFYLPKDQTALISAIEASAIDEVSVGISFKRILCSECGFDYLGKEATAINLWDRTCPDGHEIGVDGVHATLSGLDRWREMSLVSLGAAKNAKIHSRASSIYSQDQADRLAANGVSPKASVLFASVPAQFSPSNKESKSMDTELLASLEAKTTAAARAELKVETLTADVASKDAKITALEAQIADLKANTDLTTVKAEADAAKEEVAALKAALSEHYKAAHVACGQTPPAELPTASVMLNDINELRVKLHQLIPTGGVGEGAGTGQGESETKTLTASARQAAFKTRG